MTEIKQFSMSDIGTRLEHLADIQELWSFAYGVLTNGTYHSEREIEQAHELEVALRLLERHMQTGYSPTSYAQEINNLPSDATKIKGGRNGEDIT